MNLNPDDIASALKLLQCLSGDTPKNTCCNDGKIEIVVLQRGWVAVGRFYREGDECRLESASVIRVWGTDKGLGQIALDGPQSKTKLDIAGTMRFNAMTIVTRLDCNQEKWNEKLS